MRFSEAVHAIVAQQLLPQKDEKGRVPAVEVLIASPAIRECLKDSARTAHVKSIMADSRKELGTQTYNQHLDELVEAEQITPDTRQAALAISPSASAAPTVVSYGRRGPGKAASR